MWCCCLKSMVPSFRKPRMLPPWISHGQFCLYLGTQRLLAYPASVHVDDQDQSLKFIHSIYARSPYLVSSFLGVPDLKVSSTMLWTRSSKLKVS